VNEYRWEEIQIGLKAEFEASFTEEMMQSFAQISGDYNPLHVDAEYAFGHGYMGPVVFGMMTSSLYSRLAGMYLPGKYALLHGIDIDFNNAVFAGDRLIVHGEVSYLTEAYRRFEVRAKIRKTDGRLVSKATIRVGFHE